MFVFRGNKVNIRHGCVEKWYFMQQESESNVQSVAILYLPWGEYQFSP